MTKPRMAATCPECGKYNGHFSWCSRAFTVDELFALLAADVRAVPFKHEDFWLMSVGVPESGDLR
jgi:hypothetical protein